jgi:hypothetical protein
MSMTDQSLTHRSTTDPRGQGGADTIRRAVLRETKPSPKTTELWLTIIGVALLTVVYNASHDASLNLFRACLLGTVMGAAYIVSRGFAKAGSHDDNVGEYERS